MIILTFWCSWCFGQTLEETEGWAQEETKYCTFVCTKSLRKVLVHVDNLKANVNIRLM